MTFVATWMDLEFAMLSEVREDKGVTHVWNLVFLNDTNELIYKTDRHRKQIYGFPKGKGNGGVKI